MAWDVSVALGEQHERAVPRPAEDKALRAERSVADGRQGEPGPAGDPVRVGQQVERDGPSPRRARAAASRPSVDGSTRTTSDLTAPASPELAEDPADGSPTSSTRWEHETMTAMTPDLSGRNVGRKV